MVAGATGIDLFLLVIAADDGVMPQTVEHLAIIELLGVRHGVVALTKADLVDEELLELARGGRARVPRTYALRRLRGRHRERPRRPRNGASCSPRWSAPPRTSQARRRDGPARLPVDRVFPLKGIGTVVTGTLWRGEIRAGRRAGRGAGRHPHHRAQRAGARPRGRGRARRQPRGRQPARPRPRRGGARQLAGRAGGGRPRLPALRRLGAGGAGRQAAALRRPGASAPRHGAVPRQGGAARGARDRAPARRRRRSCGSTATPSSSRTTASSCAPSRRSRRSAAGKCSSPGARRWHDRGRHAAFLAALARR